MGEAHLLPLSFHLRGAGERGALHMSGGPVFQVATQGMPLDRLALVVLGAHISGSPMMETDSSWQAATPGHCTDSRLTHASLGLELRPTGRASGWHRPRGLGHALRGLRQVLCAQSHCSSRGSSQTRAYRLTCSPYVLTCCSCLPGLPLDHLALVANGAYA